MITFEGLINFYTPYHYVALIALIAAIYLYYTQKISFPFFIPFLLIHVFVELFLVYYFGKIHKNNLVVYNYFNTIIISYYFYIYWWYFKHKLWSKYIIYIFIFWLIYALYILLTQDLLAKFYNHYSYGLIIISILIIVFFKDVLDDKNIIDVRKLPIFYFSLGILLLFFSSFVFIFFPEKLITNYDSLFTSYLIQFSNLLLNLGYLGTVICRKMI
jgi:hypothetical protein